MVGTSATVPLVRKAATASRNSFLSRTICTAERAPIEAEQASFERTWGQVQEGQAGKMAGETPHFIVFANEKGGTGKSTTAVHSAVALAAAGRRVAAVDLDTRQRTLGRYLDNR